MRNPQSPQTNVVISRPAPNGGLNARDSLSSMPDNDAVELINWIPDAGGIRCRKGYREWATNLLSGVQAVFPYFSPTDAIPGGTFLTTPTVMPGKLFAATKDSIYEVTTTTNAPAISRALGGTTYSGWFTTAMLTNTAGSFLLAVSEDDGYYRYNGAAWVKLTLGAGANQVANVDPALFAHVLVWKRRAWFVQKSTTKAWYLATDAIEGAATAIDFGPLFKHGGSLAYLATWTIDAGEGMDDFLVAVSSNGDIAVYKGTDPAAASTFSLVGTWYVGQIPVGRRGACQYGGDLVIVSSEGIFPISYVTRGGAGLLVASSQEYSSKIRARIGPILRGSFSTRGWEMMLHASERLMLVNVPPLASHPQTQFALNTTLNQWCQLADIPVACMGQTAGYAFAGTADGRVLILFTNFYDNVPYSATVGSGIYGVIMSSFSSLGAPALNKIVHMVRPHFVGAARPGVIVKVAVNYQTPDIREYPSFSVGSSSLWDTGLWDSARWTSLTGTHFGDWAGAGGVGVAATAFIQTACAGDTLLTSVDYMHQVGGPL